MILYFHRSTATPVVLIRVDCSVTYFLSQPPSFPEYKYLLTFPYQLHGMSPQSQEPHTWLCLFKSPQQLRPTSVGEGLMGNHISF